MKPAILLAAGLGTRLAPLTDTTPKALVRVAGKTMLEWQLQKLRNNGFDTVVVNVHHFAGQIKDFLKENNNFGMNITVSDESSELLDTGGGIRQAFHILNTGLPVLVCNVDIFSTVRLDAFYNSFDPAQSDALLMTSMRKGSRAFCFDKNDVLVGWTNRINGEVRSPIQGFKEKLVRGIYSEYSFQGYHVMSARLLEELDKVAESKFGITDFYINTSVSMRYMAYHEPAGTQWVDAGKTKSLSLAAAISALY
ncbi:MAG: NTP transferase domain-containing protein [Bacteroidaceae bacterium]|nr:NTP transferase domain-containing protein [Bacteroidaceae bacterium]